MVSNIILNNIFINYNKNVKFCEERYKYRIFFCHSKRSRLIRKSQFVNLFNKTKYIFRFTASDKAKGDIGTS